MLKSIPKKPARLPSCKSTAEQQGREFSGVADDGNAAKREEMIKRSGRTTVPRFLLTHSTLAAVMTCMHWMTWWTGSPAEITCERWHYIAHI